MFKIELDAVHLVRIIVALHDTAVEYDSMKDCANKDGEDEDALEYFLQSRKYKNLIASIEDQMKEQSK
jgi:hypothetical protein